MRLYVQLMKISMVDKIFKILGILIIAGLVFILRPVPIVAEEDALIDSGIVSSIYGGGVKDVVFILENGKHRYYINRGLENGLDLKELREKLIGKKVTIKYPYYWTPLDWDDETKHLSKLETETEVIFNELK